MKKSFKIFADFDGTITTQDVGEVLFSKFGDAKKVEHVVRQLLNDEISSRDCWIQLCKSVDKISKNDFDQFIDTMAIDSSFIDFYHYCQANDFQLIVLSDGFDYYIERIFNKEGLNHIKFFANKLEISNDGKMIPSFPYYDSACNSSANCKRNHVISNSGDDEFTIYIGDGNSDKYTIDFCDYIFAKDDLLKYCERNRISFFPFKNFFDVKTRMELLHSKKYLKKRLRAELKRKEVYKAE